jgi:hypothetical protein
MIFSPLPWSIAKQQDDSKALLKSGEENIFGKFVPKRLVLFVLLWYDLLE